jgi:hypothetical protein
VDSAVGCGGRSCLKLVRSFDVDQKQIADAVRQHIVAFSSEFGGELRVVDSNLKIQDTFEVEPDTCHFHDADLTQQSTFTFEGPKGNSIKVALTSKQTSHAEYPPPS